MAHIQVPGICGPIVFTLETSQARSHPPLDQTHLGKFDLLVYPGFDLLLASSWIGALLLIRPLRCVRVRSS